MRLRALPSRSGMRLRDREHPPSARQGRDRRKAATAGGEADRILAFMPAAIASTASPRDQQSSEKLRLPATKSANSPGGREILSLAVENRKSGALGDITSIARDLRIS